jgi:hypothetical protein
MGRWSRSRRPPSPRELTPLLCDWLGSRVDRHRGIEDCFQPLWREFHRRNINGLMIIGVANLLAGRAVHADGVRYAVEFYWPLDRNEPFVLASLDGFCDWCGTPAPRPAARWWWRPRRSCDAPLIWPKGIRRAQAAELDMDGNRCPLPAREPPRFHRSG